MKKEFRTIDGKKQILQVTTVDERWYVRPAVDKSGLPIFEYVPSVTWIAGYYPKGIAFYKWLADKGWDESQAVKQAAGNKGSKVHRAIELLEQNKALPIDLKIKNTETQVFEELTPDEIEAVVSFNSWFKEAKPDLLASEITVFGDGYAGTIDRIYRIDGEIYIVDLKTSQNVWEEYILQVSAYNHADFSEFLSRNVIIGREWQKRKMAILQVGYTRTKSKFKFTEIEDKFKLFLNARDIWSNENPDAKPKQRDLPLVIKLGE